MSALSYVQLEKATLLCGTTCAGQCPVMAYHRPLAAAILAEKVAIAKAVNVQVISLDDAPKGYKDFDKGAATKYVIDPHGSVRA